MMRYYREIVLPELRKAVTGRILEQLAKRKEGLACVQTLLQVLKRGLHPRHAFHLDRLRDLIADIKVWLSERERGLSSL
jgi:hypothetical protein